MARVRRSEVQRAITGDLAAEYALRLRDEHHQTLEEIRTWLAEHGVKTSVTTIHRDRKDALKRMEVLTAKAKLAGYMADESRRTGLSTTAMNAEIAGQLIFDALQQIQTDGFSLDNAAQVIRLMEATAKLRGVEARAQLVDLQRRQLARDVDAAKAAIDAAAAKRGDGAVSREAVFAELDKIMQGAA
ncbi:MAG: DUF3486 family protein [Planctomycetes bacterium]|nr:DUF3486 family protein [Planctomycetota bacterium]